MDNRQGLSEMNGLHRDLTQQKIDTRALADVAKVFSELSEDVKRFGIDVDKYSDIIEENSKKLKKLQDEKLKKEKEYQEQLKAMIENFGASSQEVKDFTNAMEKSIESFDAKNYNDRNKIYESFESIKIEELKQKIKAEIQEGKSSSFDADYGKNKNYATANNDYLNRLEDLKLSALESFGENYEDNEAYKKALLKLNMENMKDIHDARIEDFKANHKGIFSIVGKFTDGVKNIVKEHKKMFTSFLGPLSILIEPLKFVSGLFKGVFGFLKKIGKGLFSGLGKLFLKIRSKKNPTASDVVKSGPWGMGALFIANTIKKNMGGNEDEEGFGGIGDIISSVFGKGGSFTKLFSKGGGFGKLTSGIGKFIKSPLFKVGGTAVGALLTAKDAYEGVQHAEEWGTSKISAGIGGALGGSDSGLSGALSGAGKGALLGAWAGPIGMAIGGAVGGVLGAVGGEKIANALDTAGEWISDTAKKGWETTKLAWNNFKEGVGKVKDSVVNTVSKGWNTLKEGFGKAKDTVVNGISSAWSKAKNTISGVWSGMKSVVGSAWDTVKGAVSKVKEMKDKAIGKAVDTVKSGLNFAKESAKNVMSNVKDKAKGLWEKVKSVGGKVFNKVDEMTGGSLTKVKEMANQAMDKVKDIGGKVYDTLDETTGGALTKTKEVVGEIWDKSKNVALDLADATSNLVSKVKEGTDEFANLTLEQQQLMIDEDKKFLEEYENKSWWQNLGEGLLSKITFGLYGKSDRERLAEIQGRSQSDDYLRAMGYSDNEIKQQRQLMSVDDAIIRTDGSVIKTNPKDTLVALKDVPQSMAQVKSNIDNTMNQSLNSVSANNDIITKLNSIYDVLSKILEKDLNITLPPQTRYDLDMVMCGGTV